MALMKWLFTRWINATVMSDISSTQKTQRKKEERKRELWNLLHMENGICMIFYDTKEMNSLRRRIIIARVVKVFSALLLDWNVLSRRAERERLRMGVFQPCNDCGTETNRRAFSRMSNLPGSAGRQQYHTHTRQIFTCNFKAITHAIMFLFAERQQAFIQPGSDLNERCS